MDKWSLTYITFLINFRQKYMFHKMDHWRVTAGSSYQYGKKKNGLMKVIKVMRILLQSGCLQRWGWWGRWWARITRIYQIALRRNSKIRSSSHHHLQITAATLLTIITTTTAQLGLVLIATQLRLLFGGVDLEAQWYLNFLSFLINNLVLKSKLKTITTYFF